ncbi:Protein EXORDIUM-like 3 [Forsythia ovata]|uniref:Protein EXORDIUM-like 3 n=1 Tax=Forsythia ovata TaxID=205694 RepID=A0ABD1S5E8_9LAMI
MQFPKLHDRPPSPNLPKRQAPFFFTGPVVGWRPWPSQKPNTTDFIYGGSKKYEGSSEFVHLKYHMGPVLTANITVYPIWYGIWKKSQKRIIRDFISSFSTLDSKPPSVAGWWKTVRIYTDQTGANISRNVYIGAEKNDRLYSHGKSLTQLSVQSVINRRHSTASDQPEERSLPLTDLRRRIHT